MCGIAGSTIKSKIHFAERLKRMRHRGPDNTGINEIDSILLGHLRLSILDLNDRSNQPFFFKNLTITYNGEIYNYKEIRKKLVRIGYKFLTESDTEVVIKAWHAFGKKCINMFRGMWAFAIYDKTDKQLILSRDYFGIKPLYYCDSKGFEFASELKFFDLLAKNIDYKILNTFIITGKTNFSNQTFFKNVTSIQPGEILVYSLTRKNIVSSEIVKPTDKYVSRDTVMNSVKAHLVSDVEVCASLSGGIDSSTIVCASNSEKPLIKTVFTANSKSFDDDYNFSSRLASNLKLKHNILLIDNIDLKEALINTIKFQDEPFDGFSIVLQNQLYKYISKSGFKVNLSGQGADEIFLGYKKYLKLKLLNKNFITKIKFLKKVIKYNSDISILDSLIALWPSFHFIPKLYYYFLSKFIFKKTNEYFNYYDNFFRLSKLGLKEVQDFEIYGSNLQSLLRYEDRNSMNYSVESRVPFVDKYIFLENYNNVSLLDDIRFKQSLIDKNILPPFLKNRKSKIGFNADIKDFIKDNKTSILNEVKNSKFLSNNINLNFINFFSETILIRLWIIHLWRKHCLLPQ